MSQNPSQKKMDRDLDIPRAFLQSLGHPATDIPARGPIRSDDGEVVITFNSARRQYLKRSPLPRHWSLLNKNSRTTLEGADNLGKKTFLLFRAGAQTFAIPWKALKDFPLHQSRPKGEGLLVLQDWDGMYCMTGRGKGVRLPIEDYRV
jgi:hypothetical protein